MTKIQRQSYICLTLFKQDIEELIQLFQDNLQDVEIVIDDLHIRDGAQLHQFDSAYKAKSLLARGYSSEILEDAPKSQGERLLIELKINSVLATLLSWKEDKGKVEPEISVLIRKLLLRCQNSVHVFMAMVGYWLLVYLFLSLSSPLQQHHVNFILQLFLVFGGGVLLMVTAFFLSASIIRVLKMETQVFLLPGKLRTTQVYGRREAVGRLIVALVVLIVFSGSLAVVFRLLWR